MSFNETKAVKSYLETNKLERTIKDRSEVSYIGTSCSDQVESANLSGFPEDFLKLEYEDFEDFRRETEKKRYSQDNEASYRPSNISTLFDSSRFDHFVEIKKEKIKREVNENELSSYYENYIDDSCIEENSVYSSMSNFKEEVSISCSTELSDCVGNKQPSKLLEVINSKEAQVKNPSQKSGCVPNTRIHALEKTFMCSFCSFSGFRKSDITRHMRIHTGEKPFKCSLCPYCASQNSSLIAHMRTHTGEKPYKCPHCPHSLAVKSDLTRHIRIHTGEKPFICSLCSFSSYDRSSLNRHMKIHTGEKPFKCSHCSFSGSSKSSLVIHMRIHTGEKPFECTICSFSASDKSNFRKHMKIHTGEKPYKCSNCSFSAYKKSNLIRHLKTHNREQVP